MNTTAPARGRAWTWWVCGLLLLATTINYMDRQTLSNAALRIKAEFQLNKEQYGNIELAFGWAFAVGSLCFGYIADRFSVRWLYPAVLLLWSAMGFASGFVTSYESLMMCRAFLGFFEAGHWPCAIKTTYALLAAKDRTMGNSVLQSGASVGAIITPLLMRALMTEQPGSWRFAFQAIGLVGLLWIVFWFATIRATDLKPKAEEPIAPGAVTTLVAAEESFWKIVFSARFLALALTVFCIHTCWHLFRVWLPQFMQEGRGYSEADALNFNAVFYIATDIGCLAAGAVTVWLNRRLGFSAHRARVWVYAGCALLTTSSVLLYFLPKGPLLLAVLLVVAAGSLGLFPCYYAFVQELSAKHVGKFMGLLGTWVWAVSSPVHKYFGKFIDRTGSFDLGMAAAGLAPMVGLLCLWALWSRHELARGK